MQCKLQAHKGVASCESVFMYCICIVYVYKYVFKYICIVCVPSVFGMYEVRMKCVRSANSSRCCLSRVCFHVFMCIVYVCVFEYGTYEVYMYEVCMRCKHVKVLLVCLKVRPEQSCPPPPGQ